MSYNVNIPASGTKIRNTFNLIQQNFLQLNQLYGSLPGKDHVEFDNATTANRGLHKQVTVINTSAPAVPADPISILHTIADGFGKPQLKFINSTNSSQYTLGVTTGSIVLMGGIILKWGQAAGGTGTTNVAFAPNPGDFPNNCFSVLVTGRNSGTNTSGFNVNTISNTGFSVYGSSHTNIYWFAIGN